MFGLLILDHIFQKSSMLLWQLLFSKRSLEQMKLVFSIKQPLKYPG